jgi:hypothetical protein
MFSIQQTTVTVTVTVSEKSFINYYGTVVRIVFKILLRVIGFVQMTCSERAHARTDGIILQ